MPTGPTRATCRGPRGGAAANIWPNASGQHVGRGRELRHGHLRPRVQPQPRHPRQLQQPVRAIDQRAGTGPWDMLSRGTFNGPGGPHTRWLIVEQLGSSLGSKHNLAREPAAARVPRRGQRCPAEPERARDAVRSRRREDHAARRRSRTQGAEPASRSRSTVRRPSTTTRHATRRRPARSATRERELRRYRVEAVQQVGNDSFAPGHGMLISKSERTAAPPIVWMIDANPQDIGKIDFNRPDGTPVAVVRGDPRQLNDATFPAGPARGARTSGRTPSTGSISTCSAEAQKCGRCSQLRHRCATHG